jgi:hypothetical protein
LILKGFLLPKKLKGEIEMIHTFKLMFELHYHEVQDLQRRLGINYKQLNRHFEGMFDGVTMAITNSGNGIWKLYMVVDAIKLLGKPDINEADYEVLEKELRYILWNVVGHASHYRNQILLRVDFRYDVIIEDRDTRKLLMALYKKQTESFRFQKQYLGKVEKGKFIPYKTTVYHSSNSIESMVYLKMEERETKKEKVEEYEKNVIRYEVHVKEDHLYYMERKRKGDKRKRKLIEYIKKDVFTEYFQKYMFSIYHQGDFYKIDEVRHQLKSSSLSTSNKLKLIQFLKQVSSHSIDTPHGKISKGTYKKRLELLREIDINPILIPKNYTSKNSSFKAPSYMRNPLKDFHIGN